VNTLVEFIGLDKQIGNTKVVENINFTIYSNDIFGYLGPNGAGKTTTIRLLLGLLTPTKGKVLVAGRNPNEKDVRGKIGFCLDDDGLYNDLTAWDNLEFFDRIYNSSQGRQKRISDLLEKMELSKVSNKKVWEFSKGMKRRLALGRALITNPILLVLDEPMSGLDPDGQLLFRGIIKNLAQDITVFFSSHNLAEVENTCNRVAIINKTILVSDSVENLRSNNSSKVFRVKLKQRTEIVSDVLQEINRLVGVTRVLEVNESIDIFHDDSFETEIILKILLDNDLKITEISTPKANLEDVYFNLTRGENNA